jgi:hypothetical protein
VSCCVCAKRTLGSVGATAIETNVGAAEFGAPPPQAARMDMAIMAMPDIGSKLFLKEMIRPARCDFI